MGKKERVAAKAKRVDPNPAEGRKGARRRGFLYGVGAGLALLVAYLAFTMWPRGMQVLPMERVPIKEMSVPRFLAEYSAQKPVVLTGAWPEDGWRPAELAAACPLAEVRTFRHDEQSESWARHVQVGLSPLREYYKDFFEAAPADRPRPLLYGFEMQLTQYCPERLEHVRLPAFFAEDAFHLVTNRTGLGWPSVLLGPQGSETGLHIDTHRLPFWIAVIAPKASQGSPLKRVRVFPHDDARLLKYGQAGKKGVNFLFDWNPWRPDYQRYPDLADAHVFEAELRSGDMLYIPGGSPHAVVNLADNVGVSMNFLDLKSLPDFARKCNTQSPLCGLLAGKGEWVLQALEERRQLDKEVSYWEFAGISDRQDFCKVHSGGKGKDDLQKYPALVDYCK